MISIIISITVSGRSVARDPPNKKAKLIDQFPNIPMRTTTTGGGGGVLV